jgi:hypothetical protein
VFGPDWATLFDSTLHLGLVQAQWNAAGGDGIFTCSDKTWSRIRRDDEWSDAVLLLLEEAKKEMPKAVVADLSLLDKAKGVKVADPNRTAPQPAGITALTAQITSLVVEMNRYGDSPAMDVQRDFATRYGRLREAVLALRGQFTEAEAAFEVAQAKLVSFMGD